jgi:hypothetical protein
MAWLWWAVPHVGAVFGWTLNEFLRGSARVIISGAITWTIFGLVGVAFFVSGWKFGIGAFVGAFVLVALLCPLASAVAKKLIDFPDLGYDKYADRHAQQIVKRFGPDQDFEERGRDLEEESCHRAAAVSSAMKNRTIANLLVKLSATDQDLAALYDRLEVHSLPPQVRETVLANAALIEFWLENSEPFVQYDGSHGRKITAVDTALRLGLWTRSNPGGDEPRRSG